ncbi:3-keto-5-aminohexanoate cleavage protein [Acrocarpospora sp. B8E8]|uniref:3-keto-5-aminohexanoate cleavage protein n=1 Tax=Acrocarpospora sp. B8E8 TaxID=3153572 RepID=UPI00325E6B82
MKKLVIGVHPNEGTMREPNPHVPWTPEEIADDTAAAREAGAAVVRFHARTATGAGTPGCRRWATFPWRAPCSAAASGTWYGSPTPG